MMRLLFVASDLRTGGAERSIARLVHGLRARSHFVEVACLRGVGPVAKALRHDGVTVHGPVLRHRLDLRGWSTLTRLMRDGAFDAVYLNKQPLTELVGTLTARRARRAVVVAAAHYTVRRGTRRLRQVWANRLMQSRIDRFIALSETHCEQLCADEGIAPERVVIIPNGIEAALYGGDRSARAAVRRELGLVDDQPVFAIVARLSPEKNHPLLFAALRPVAQQHNAALLVIGDGDERGALERARDELALAPHIRFLGQRSDVPRLLQACDVGVLSSLPTVETQPLAVLEYMASCLPVVATRVGSLSGMVEDERTGFLVPSGDESALSGALLRLAGDAPFRRALGSAGYDAVTTRFTASRAIESTEALLQDLVGRSRRAPRVVVRTALRVLVLSNMYPARDNPGFGSFVQQQVTSIRALGVDVTVEARSRPRRADYVPFYARSVRSLSEGSFDLIHAHYGFHSALAPLLLRGSVPLVVTFHGSDALGEPGRNRLYGLMQRLCARTSTRLIAVSSEVRDALVRDCGADAARVDIISCGVDITRFQPAADRIPARKDLGLHVARPVVVWVGRGSALREKGVDIVLDCARLCPHADFVIVGLEALPGSPENCRFVGSIDNRSMPRWLQAANLCLLPSRSEGTPVALLEAMACGAPAVASCVGGVPDVLEDGVNGRLVPTLTAAAFATAINEALEMPATRRREMELAARATVVTRFDARLIAERIVNVYKMACATRS